MAAHMRLPCMNKGGLGACGRTNLLFVKAVPLPYIRRLRCACTVPSACSYEKKTCLPEAESVSNGLARPVLGPVMQTPQPGWRQLLGNVAKGVAVLGLAVALVSDGSRGSMGGCLGSACIVYLPSTLDWGASAADIVIFIVGDRQSTPCGSGPKCRACWRVFWWQQYGSLILWRQQQEFWRCIKLLWQFQCSQLGVQRVHAKVGDCCAAAGIAAQGTASEQASQADCTFGSTCGV